MKLITRLLVVVTLCSVIGGCAGSYLSLEKPVRRELDAARKSITARKVYLVEKHLRNAISETKYKTDVHLIAIDIAVSGNPSTHQLVHDLCCEAMDLSDKGRLDRKLTHGDVEVIFSRYLPVCISMKPSAETIDVLARLQKMQPDDPDIMNALGYCYADMDIDPVKSLVLTKRAVALDPNNPMFIDSLGWAYYKLGKYPEAVRELKKACCLLPGDPEVRYHLGAAYYQNNKLAEARIELKKSILMDPSNIPPRKLMQKMVGMRISVDSK